MVRMPMNREIDVMHLERDRVICAYELGGLIVDPGPASSLQTLLEALGGDEPRGLLLTHVHLDHAGATGVLVRRFPGLRVYVHERGAPHLIDPSKLLKSAAQLYGDDMDRLWGEVAPVPKTNITSLSGGETIEGFRVAYTPGHAWHHVSYLHEKTGDAYVGDVAGVRIPPSGFTMAPTPPPDIDLEAWRESLDTVEGWRPERLCLTHFGAFEDADEHLAGMRERLDAWSGLARDMDRESFVAEIEQEVEAEADADTAASFFQAAPPEQAYLGLERYWSKKREGVR
jgi:glyoxylase-like metal-dependent hydrolase (beta-lactamase superfamily II)